MLVTRFPSRVKQKQWPKKQDLVEFHTSGFSHLVRGSVAFLGGAGL